MSSNIERSNAPQIISILEVLEYLYYMNRFVQLGNKNCGRKMKMHWKNYPINMYVVERYTTKLDTLAWKMPTNLSNIGYDAQ